MNKLIAFVIKISGFGWIWDKLSGYKTKIGAISLILSGLAELTQKISTLTDFASVLVFVKGLPLDAGWLALLAGIAALGIGHKLEKAAATDPAPKP